MKRKIECVEEFHRIYKLGNSDKPIGKLENGLEKLRFDLMSIWKRLKEEMSWRLQMLLAICFIFFVGQ